MELGKFSSVLLIGRNGAGKTTVGRALEVLQQIARGTNRVGELVRPKDLTQGRSGMRFQIEASVKGRIYVYSVAFEFPTGFRELRVSEEKLIVDGQPIFSRELAQVKLARTGMAVEAAFRIDWHLVALPIVQEQSQADPLSIFKQWLGSMLVLRPVPSLIGGDSDQDTLQPDAQVSDVGAWFSGLVTTSPSSYAEIGEYLRHVMPDFKEVTNPVSGKDTRSLLLHFRQSDEKVSLSLDDLSDGEKCFLVFALTIATNRSYGPIICFWDEPDNFLAPAEVGPSVMALRRAFRDDGQLIVTSHNPEAIRRFSDENTLVMYRNSHLEPTVIRSVEDIRASGQFDGGFIDALLRGDVGQ